MARDHKRIGLFLPSLDGGGAQRVVLTLANALAARKEVHVDLVLAKMTGPFVSQIDQRVRVVNLDVKRVAMSMPGLMRYLRKESPNVVLSSLNYVNIVAILARAVARSSTRIVVGEHNTLSQSKSVRRRTKLVPVLMRLTYPHADLVVAVSNGVAEDLCRNVGLKRDSVHVIYNPVVREEMFAEADQKPEHKWFKDEGAPVVLGMGRLTEQKDFGNLIRAVALLRETRPVRLMILGEGERRQELIALVDSLGLKEYVELPGFVDNPYAFMRRAAVFALSSRWEGLPTVLIEAMACGARVVATDCPSGPREILEGGAWGRLVSVGDSVALAKAIEAALDDPNPPDVVSRAQDFSVDAAVNKYLDVLCG